MKVLNRIVTFILALGVFPVFIFQNLVRAVVSVAKDSSLYTLLSQIMKDTINSKMEINVSVKELLGYIQDGKFSFAGMDFSISSLPSSMLTTKNWLIASAVFIVIALLIALVIMGCALFTNAHKTVMCLGAGGAISLFVAVRCFTRFAAPFVDGTVDIGKILAGSLLGENKSLLGSIGSGFLEGAISVDVLQLGNVAIVMALLFIGVSLWTLAYYLTMPPEKKNKVKA